MPGDGNANANDVFVSDTTCPTDSDADSAADCTDECPYNAGKTSAGICGCATADTDSDSEGYADCIDECVSNSDKVVAGICGCSVADADADDDGTVDCNEGCPNDELKTDPGECGCGVSEADTNKNGAPDCIDPTSETDPSITTLSGSARRPTLNFQQFDGRVKYNIELSKDGKVSKSSSESPRRSTSDLPVGKWKVRYSVTVGYGSSAVTSKKSGWKNFTIR